MPRSLTPKDTDETICFEFFLGLKDILWIVDGRHRRWVVALVLQFLKEVLPYPGPSQ